MRLDNERPSENVEDRRGQGGAGGGFGFPRGGGGRGINIPMGGGRGGFSISTIVMLVIVYFAIKFFFGIDLLEVINGGGVQAPGGGTNTEMTIPKGNTDVAGGDVQGGATTPATDVTGDAGKDFVAACLGLDRARLGRRLSSKWARPIRSPISFSSPALCSRPAAWRNRPWVRFIARATARSISTCPSTRT